MTAVAHYAETLPRELAEHRRSVMEPGLNAYQLAKRVRDLRGTAAEARETADALDPYRSMPPGARWRDLVAYPMPRRGERQPPRTDAQRAAAERLAQYEAAQVLSRAVANQTTADLTGLLPGGASEAAPVPLGSFPLIEASTVVDVIKGAAVIDVAGIIAVPTAGPQTSGEKTELPTAVLPIANVTGPKLLAGFTVDVSTQAQGWTLDQWASGQAAMVTATNVDMERQMLAELDVAAVADPDLDTAISAALGVGFGLPDLMILGAPDQLDLLIRRYPTTTRAELSPGTVAVETALAAGTLLVIVRSAVNLRVTPVAELAVLEPGLLGTLMAVYREGCAIALTAAAVRKVTTP